jgi:hypothetical protein
LHEGDEPNALADLRDADILAGEGVAQIHLSPVEANPSAMRHGELGIVEANVDANSPCGSCTDLRPF